MEMKRKMKDVRFDDDCRIGLDVIVKKRKAGVWQPTQTAAWAFTGHGIALLCCEIVLTNSFLIGLGRVVELSSLPGPVGPRSIIHSATWVGSLSARMHLMYTVDDQGNRVYTLKVSVLFRFF